ncbi:hypothetical protein Scep_018613 [Stephania cephalantha]|uniref:Uncharacterized protein n=1 Tax=Stephania cephalantha TaxID=152367 RepID=A0AAP0I997_9MAGN
MCLTQVNVSKSTQQQTTMSTTPLLYPPTNNKFKKHDYNTMSFNKKKKKNIDQGNKQLIKR